MKLLLIYDYKDHLRLPRLINANLHGDSGTHKHPGIIILNIGTPKQVTSFNMQIR